MSEVRSKNRSLSPGGEPSGVLAEEQGSTVRTVQGPDQLSEKLAHQRGSAVFTTHYLSCAAGESEKQVELVAL